MNEMRPDGLQGPADENLQNSGSPVRRSGERLTRMQRRRLEEEQVYQQPSGEPEGGFVVPETEPEAPEMPAAPQPRRRRADRNAAAASAEFQPAEPVREEQPVTASKTQKSRKARSSKNKTSRAKAPSKSSLLINRLLMLVCVAVFACSSFLLIRYFYNIWITDRAGAQLEQVYQAAMVEAETEPTAEPAADPGPTATPRPTAVPLSYFTENAKRSPVPTVKPTKVPEGETIWPRVYPDNPTLRVSSVFYELQRQNSDIVGWLKINDVLEEAVVQRDNVYYLNHNALRQESLTGALFLDEKCDLKSVPTQTLLHGHNMKEGAMFGSLKKYKVKGASFYRDHAYIEFNTIYENSTYVIFAAAEVDLRWNKPNYLPFWTRSRFDTALEFSDYVKKARDLSLYHCNVDVVPGDRLLTLSTCTGNDDNERLVVLARRVRPGEDRTQLNMAVMSTTDR